MDIIPNNNFAVIETYFLPTQQKTMLKNKLIVTLAIAGIPCFTLGQIKQNAVLLGGQITYYRYDMEHSTSQPGQKSRTVQLNLSAGKALKENSVYGLNLSYSPLRMENYFNGNELLTVKQNRYNFGVFYRKYNKVAKDFYFFSEFGGSYLLSRQTYADSAGIDLQTRKQSGAELFLTPGLSYRILKKLHLEIIIPKIISIQYAVTKSKMQNQEDTEKLFLFNSSLNADSGGLGYVGVGFHFIL